MKDSKDFYIRALYPFQDGVIKILSALETPFFLTVGTALARGYLGHRFSDDPVSAAEIVASFLARRFDAIKWSEPPDRDSFAKDLRTIAQEILRLPTNPKR